MPGLDLGIHDECVIVQSLPQEASRRRTDCRLKPGNDDARRAAGLLLILLFAVLGGLAYAQSPASPPAGQTVAPAPSAPAPADQAAQQPAAPDNPPAAATPNNPPTVDDICSALEQDAAENELPVEFFARVIWQESRFNARAVSKKGAEGIAQFMPSTADYRGLIDPFDPIEALKNSASYLHDLKTRFGNLGLAAAAYNAGPGRVAAWLSSHRGLPSETRNYVAIITGWTADDRASPSPP
jgi:soluble lytic murein transglycosylase-like protein